MPSGMIPFAHFVYVHCTIWLGFIARWSWLVHAGADVGKPIIPASLLVSAGGVAADAHPGCTTVV
jgi:hypothetical protein